MRHLPFAVGDCGVHLQRGNLHLLFIGRRFNLVGGRNRGQDLIELKNIG
jgi:hypothetical protein